MRLADFSFRPPPRIGPDAPAEDALRLMHHLNTPVLIVCDCGPDDPVGCLWEDNLLGAVSEGVDGLVGLTARDRMVPRLDVCYTHQSIEEARRMLAERRAPLLGIFDAEECFLGIVLPDDLTGTHPAAIAPAPDPTAAADEAARSTEQPSFSTPGTESQSL